MGEGKVKLLLILVAVFIISITVSVIAFESNNQVQKQIAKSDDTDIPAKQLLLSGEDQPSPSDWIKEEQITVLKDRVVIYLDNPSWARFADTNSMDPLIDIGSHGVEIKPESPEQIRVGDVIAYKTEDFDGVIIHRVHEIGQDDQGYFFITKGDNNKVDDGIKIRFNQIMGVLVIVIW
ncbi:signal peptidase I [Candidatus Woesearchaeota archaeon]|nr:signal peptidase I [Candidatus Woesearchaeota archaeon]